MVLNVYGKITKGILDPECVASRFQVQVTGAIPIFSPVVSYFHQFIIISIKGNFYHPMVHAYSIPYNVKASGEQPSAKAEGFVD